MFLSTGQFIRNLPTSAADQVLVRSMVEIARGLGMETIAEFVEEEEALELLGQYGVDYAQGYLVGRPGSIEDQLSGASAGLIGGNSPTLVVTARNLVFTTTPASARSGNTFTAFATLPAHPGQTSLRLRQPRQRQRVLVCSVPRAPPLWGPRPG